MKVTELILLLIVIAQSVGICIIKEQKIEAQAKLMMCETVKK